MNRKNFCQACSNEKFGVKTRHSVEHTCGNGTYQKEPEAVHGNEAKKEVCEHRQIVDLGDGVSQCRKCFELFEDD